MADEKTDLDLAYEAQECQAAAVAAKLAPFVEELNALCRRHGLYLAASRMWVNVDGCDWPIPSPAEFAGK